MGKMIPATCVERWIEETVTSLAYLHTKGIIHRFVYLSDFFSPKKDPFFVVPVKFLIVFYPSSFHFLFTEMSNQITSY